MLPEEEDHHLHQQPNCKRVKFEDLRESERDRDREPLKFDLHINNKMNIFPTSEGTLLSTIHGRDRRSLRSIGKKDLLAARKYGKRERSYRNRWKFTFADIVYITENDEVTEVTSWVIPVEIPLVQLTNRDVMAHNALVQKMRDMPSICSSHIVLVIDQSASMRTCDVDNYKTRSDAVFASTALDYVGKQIDDRGVSSNAQYTDAITLIEMSEFPTIVFEREPCTNVFFNKLLDRKASVKPRGHGMFGSALSCAKDVMMVDKENESCTLVLLFLSDGKPSDFIKNPFFDAGQQMFELCSQFKEQLTVVTLGFGKCGSDFSVLQTMAKRACDAGAIGSFKAVDTSGNDLSTTLANLSETMNATRQMCSMLNINRGPRTLRPVTNERERPANYQFSTDVDNIHDGNWTLYCEGFNRLVWDKLKQALMPIGAGAGVAICNSKFGIGAERMVFRLVELNKEKSKGNFEAILGQRLVAKECKFVEDIKQEQSQFHAIFCKTQRQAAKLADKFNKFVETICKRHKLAVPAVIKFLECSVLEVPELQSEGFRTILVEKRLDPSKYTKWNSNNGYVAGQQNFVDVLNRRVIAINPSRSLLEIVEEDSEEDLSDVDEELLDEPIGATRFCILPEHFPQAFSHHTYRYTQRSQLVCDLQGVLDTSVSPAVFELTDPVIHSDDVAKRCIFGRTDRGHKGMRAFMQSHDCNELCRLLGLANFR